VVREKTVFPLALPRELPTGLHLFEARPRAHAGPGVSFMLV